MAAEPVLVRRIANLFFLGVILGAGTAYVFRAEISDAVFDSLVNNEAAIKRKWSPETGGRFDLRSERNDISFLRIAALHAAAPTSLGVPVAFELTNLGDANDFPNIAIVMIGAAGLPTRQVVFSPKDYVHYARFERQHVELLLQPHPEERSFKVQLFYEDKP